MRHAVADFEFIIGTDYEIENRHVLGFINQTGYRSVINRILGDSGEQGSHVRTGVNVNFSEHAAAHSGPQGGSRQREESIPKVLAKDFEEFGIRT